jgi:antitoxin MazE
MFMTVQVLKKWGNSPAVRIPVAIMQSAQLALDQAVEVRAEGGRIIIEPVVPAYTLDDLLSGITAENRHAEADFGIAQGQEQF